MAGLVKSIFFFVEARHTLPLHTFVIATVFLASCATDPAIPSRPLTAEFGMPGVVYVANARDISDITVISGNRTTGVKIAQTLSLGRSNFEVRFDWQVGQTYTLVTDRGERLSIHAPSEKPEFALRIHAPLGQNRYEFMLPFVESSGGSNIPSETSAVPIAVLANMGENVDILVEVEKLSGENPTEFNVSIMSPKALPEGPELEPIVSNDKKILAFEFDKAIWQCRIALKETLPSAPAVVTIERGNKTFRVPIVVTKRDIETSTVTVNNWEMPVDAWGLFQAHRLPAQVALPNPVWNKIGTFFNVQTNHISFFDPFVYQRLDFENPQEHCVNLLLKSAVVNGADGTPLLWFSPPNFSMSKGPKNEKGVLGYCQIPASSKKSCVLPIYIHPDTPAGSYERRVEIFHMGSSKRIRLMTKSFSVVRSNVLLSLWLVLVIVVSLGWIAVVIVFYRRIMEHFGVRLLVLISLLGSMQFCLQFGSRMVSTVLYAFLGPLNCLVGGLLSEVMTYLVVTSVLYLVPRVGAMTLAGIISYLMGGILFGSFGLTDVLFIGSTIAFQEIWLFGMGVTRFKVPEHYAPPFIPLMLALGLADAMSTFTSLTLHSVFYRLFFADWYIVLNVVVTGLGYTFVGVFLGRSLGQSLRKVHL